MAQKHLYTLNYEQMNPPKEWKGIRVKSTVNDDFVQANIEQDSFTFTGEIASYIKDVHVPAYGVHYGLAYRITVDDQEIIFDGFLVLSEMQILSDEGPIILKIPVRDLTNNLTSFDKVSIFTQRLLRKQGFITTAMYAHCPVVQVSKKGAKDRIIAMTNLAFTILNTFLQMIQDFLSAISDMIGTSIAVGVIEFGTLAINLLIQVQQMVNLIKDHADLLLASQTWYNAISVKDIIEAAFAKIGKTVEWGIIEDVVEKCYVKSSENGFPGTPSPTYANEGILNPNDWGYLIAEMLQEIQTAFNTRSHEDDNDTVHIKTKSDPYWTDAPSFDAEDVKIETTQQYENGYTENNTDEIFATERVIYPYDPTDAWTLTENNDDSYEVHRELISEPDPRFNTLRGLKDNRMNWALGVRYVPENTLTDILFDILGEFNVNQQLIKQYLTQFSQYIDPGSNSSQETSDFLALNPFNLFFSLTAGGLKVEDDTWGIPKFFYANKDDNNRLNIPSNFKDYIGASAIYNNYYTYDSPAKEHNYQGQRVFRRAVTIPFSLSAFQQTKTNPYFSIGNDEAKLLHSNWSEENRDATIDFEKKEIFDSNIKETVIVV